MPFYFCLLIFTCSVISCRSSFVQGTIHKAKPIAYILLGEIENRDIRYHQHINENFRDMLKYDFIESGYGVEKINHKPIISEELTDESIGGLPLVLRRAAGEANWEGTQTGQLNRKQIKTMASEYDFDYFLQGSLALHTSGKILESIDHNLFFLDIYSKDGKQIGMIRFAFEEKTIYEANLMKNLSNQVVTTFLSKIKQAGKK